MWIGDRSSLACTNIHGYSVLTDLVLPNMSKVFFFEIDFGEAVDVNTVPDSWFNITEELWTRHSRKFSMAGVPHHYNHNHYNQQQLEFI